MTPSWRCRLGLHHWVDFPDPNPEAAGPGKHEYRACTRCSRERDGRSYRMRLIPPNWPTP